MIGAALDLGQDRRGVDMGPSAIRYAGLDARLDELGHEYVDCGNVETAVAEATTAGDEQARFLPQIKDTSQRIAALVARAAREDSVPVVLGGDHSVALGTLAGLAEVHWTGRDDLDRCARRSEQSRHEPERKRARHGARRRARPGRRPVPRGRLGLPAVRPAASLWSAVRSLDDGERELLRELDAKVFTMSDVDRLGIERAIRESLTHVAGPGFVHVSLDMDAMDPEVAPGVGTPVRGGLSYREAHLAMELIAESGLAVVARRRRGEPDPRPGERDGAARRRARRLGARRADSLSQPASRRSSASAVSS